jgi:hypothetical protein
MSLHEYKRAVSLLNEVPFGATNDVTMSASEGDSRPHVSSEFQYGALASKGSFVPKIVLTLCR